MVMASLSVQTNSSTSRGFPTKLRGWYGKALEHGCGLPQRCGLLQLPKSQPTSWPVYGTSPLGLDCDIKC